MVVESTICMLVALASLQSEKDAIRNMMGLQDPRFNQRGSFTIARITQQYWHDISVYMIDTTSGDTKLTIPRPPEYRPWFAAVDKHGRVYKLFGFDSTDFGELPWPDSAFDCFDSVIMRGQAFVEYLLLYDYCGIYFIKSVDDFVDLNRSRTKDTFDLEINRAGDWNTQETLYRSLLEKCNFSRVIYDMRERQFYVDYYVWLDRSGDLIHLNVAISKSGKCTLVAQERLASDLGFHKAHPY